ncbi:hypothetical protein EYF80_049802 [Liparis tanakae]|uniref:Uncharacterized protein n=1 Tax=Liparis tanakae TaxID=230148 RepID=A0A4Z2FGK3_9TELE|nr:hypothetical protein EYF80_049802 [Liparis tanakae]
MLPAPIIILVAWIRSFSDLAMSRLASSSSSFAPPSSDIPPSHAHSSVGPSLGLDDDAVALVDAVALADVLVEEEAAVGHPGLDHAEREEEEGQHSLPYLEERGERRPR